LWVKNLQVIREWPKITEQVQISYDIKSFLKIVCWKAGRLPGQKIVSSQPDWLAVSCRADSVAGWLTGKVGQLLAGSLPGYLAAKNIPFFLPTLHCAF